MIEFPCHCRKYTFSLPDEMAGGMIQCPQCSRLCDVPQLSELGSIEPDGIFKIGADPTHEDNPETIDALTRVHTRSRTDDEGFDIDLREHFGDDSTIGADQVPLEMHDHVRPGAPKYDPFTGELVRPMDVKPDHFVDPNSIPLAKPVGMPKRRAEDIPSALECLAIPARLWKPANLIVMCFIFLGHLLYLFFVATLAMGLFFVYVAQFFIGMILVAHYGNVVDETGPGARSELPAPLRNVSWSEDIWHPFKALVIALALCYWPGVMLLLRPDLIKDPAVLIVSIAWATAGMIAFPAIFMTTCTSGTLQNLRPDRILSVIWHCGFEYVISVLLWCVAGPIYLVSAYMTSQVTYLWIRNMVSWSSQVIPIEPLLQFSWPGLLVGIFLMHWFCWHLGTLYRKHQPRFQWILQSHTRTAGSRAPSRGFAVLRKPRPAKKQVIAAAKAIPLDPNAPEHIPPR